MIADDELKTSEEPLYQNQMQDPAVAAQYDDYFSSLFNSSSDTLPDL